MLNVELEGVQSVIRALSQIENDLSRRELGSTLRAAGGLVVKHARKKISPSYGSELIDAAKRDLRVFSKDRLNVSVGLGFKLLRINGDIQKAAPIIRHLTVGFNQTDRRGKENPRKRGRVRSRVKSDFVADGLAAATPEIVAVMDKKVKAVVSKRRA